jgi:hypothetical protein
MTDLDTMIRTCLEEHAELAPYVDPVAAAHARSRAIAQRQHVMAAAATAGVVAAGVTVGVVVSAAGPTGTSHAKIVTQGSSRPRPHTVLPRCPSGQVPNLKVNENAAPKRLPQLVPQSAGHSAISFVVGNPPVFLVNGKAPAKKELWLLVRTTNGGRAQYVVTDAGPISHHPARPKTPAGYTATVKGRLARFTGCRSAGS